MDSARPGVCSSQEPHLHSRTPHRCHHPKSSQGPKSMGLGPREAEAKGHVSPGIVPCEVHTSLSPRSLPTVENDHVFANIVFSTLYSYCHSEL